MRKSKDALKILERVTGKDPELRELIEQATVSADVAQLIYDARTKARLSQVERARLVGTTQAVIARLEDADYEGHPLAMLQRIGAALNRRLEIRFVPARRKLVRA